MPTSFLSQGKYLLTFGFFAVFMGNFGQSFFIGTYGAPIQDDLALSASSYGLIYSIATLFAGTSLMFAGGWIDRMPLARFTLWVSLGLLLACGLFVFVDNVATLGLALFFVRLCGQGLLPHTGVTVMARCFSAHRGKAISVAASGVPVGEIILPLLAALLIGLVGWQRSWLFIGVFIVVCFIPCYHFLLRRASAGGYSLDPVVATKVASANRPAGQGARRQLLMDGRFWRALPALIAAPFVVTGVFIHQSFVMAERQWSMDFFALGFIAYGIVHWIASLLAGAAVDRFSASRLLPLYNLPMFLALVAVALFEGNFLVFVLLGLLGVSIGSSGPIGGSLWAEIYGTESIGTIRSLVASFGVWSTSLSPVLFGILIDAGISLSELAAGLAVFVLFACALAAMSYKPVSTA